jgi:hypothetical protein
MYLLHLLLPETEIKIAASGGAWGFGVFWCKGTEFSVADAEVWGIEGPRFNCII